RQNPQKEYLQGAADKQRILAAVIRKQCEKARLRELGLFSLEKRLRGDLLPTYRYMRECHMVTCRHLFSPVEESRTCSNGAKLRTKVQFGCQEVPKGKPLPMLTWNCLSLLLWVLFDGGLLTPLHPQSQQTLEAETRGNVATPERKIPAVRVKRGWVWNQFFVLEEYMGSEPQYVGKIKKSNSTMAGKMTKDNHFQVNSDEALNTQFQEGRFYHRHPLLLHSDLDKGVGSVKYTLSGDGAGTVFTIDETTGDIHAIKSLDREEKPFYTLRAQAVDIDTRKPLEPESEFIIKVQDINDNEPKFLDGPYVASVPEMSP
ncbi:Cadherin-12, partial [Varanus komodoensis]